MRFCVSVWDHRNAPFDLNTDHQKYICVYQKYKPDLLFMQHMRPTLIFMQHCGPNIVKYPVESSLKFIWKIDEISGKLHTEVSLHHFRIQSGLNFQAYRKNTA